MRCLLIDGLQAAYSGFAAFGRKVSVSGHNIANSETDNFKKKELVIEIQEGGGVTTQVQKVPETRTAPEPVERITKTESARVNLGEEIVELSVAQRSFEANAQSPKTQEEILGTLIDMIC